MTADYVFENVGQLISKYRKFMGIDNLENINLEEHLKIYDPLLIPFPEVIVEYYFAQMEDLKEDDFWDEVSEEYQRHVFFIFQTSIMDKPFDGPALYFGFDEVNNVLKINGNWFSNTLVPKNEVYTKTDVTVMAYQAIKERQGIDLWESKHLFRANKLFITRKVGKKTEIRECWRVVADIGDYEKYYIFVDTQTGEVVSQYIRSRLYYI